MPGGGSSGNGGGGRGAPASGGNNNSGANSARAGVIADDDQKLLPLKGTIDAVEEIQRLYVFESQSDKDLPFDLFTFKQVLEFFYIGFRAAVIESILFFLIFPIALTVYPAAKAYFMGITPTIGDYVLPFILSYFPVVVMTIYVVSAARYYRGGQVTRKAIHSLFTGRSAGFTLKAFLGWWLLSLLYIHSYNNPSFIWSALDIFRRVANILLPKEAMISTEAIYVFWYQAVVPALLETAEDIFVSMLTLAVIPFCTLFAYGGYRYWRKLDNKKTFERYDKLSRSALKPSALHLGIGFSIDDYRKEKLKNIYQ